MAGPPAPMRAAPGSIPGAALPPKCHGPCRRECLAATMKSTQRGAGPASHCVVAAKLQQPRVAQHVHGQVAATAGGPAAGAR